MFENPELYGAVFEDQQKHVEQAVMDEYVRRQRLPIEQQQTQGTLVKQLLKKHAADGDGEEGQETDVVMLEGSQTVDWKEAARLVGRPVRETLVEGG